MCYSCKLLPRLQTLVSSLTCLSPHMGYTPTSHLVNPAGSVIQIHPESNPMQSHHLFQIHYLSPRLIHHCGLVSQHSENNPFKTYVRSFPISVQSHPVASQYLSLVLFHPCQVHLGLRVFGHISSACHDLLLDITYMLKSLRTCHLLSEDFIWLLYLNLPLSLNIPFIFFPCSIFLHNICTQHILVCFYLPPRI